MKRIVIFASGEGSNAEAIVKHFDGHNNIEVVAVLSNRLNAGVHDKMRVLGVKTFTYSKSQWNDANEILGYLCEERVDLIVLAGFLAIIDDKIIDAYPNRIINIHPSLLPRYGGVGMWGLHVHSAVIAACDTKSGITIHYVTKEVDGGEILAQYECDVLPNDTPQQLAERVHKLEHEYYPQIIEQLLIQ